MARRKARTSRTTRRTTTSRVSHRSESPSMIIQLGIVFIIVAAMLLAGYVGGLYMGK